MRILCIKLEINQGYNNTNYVTRLETYSSQPKFEFYLRARSIAFLPRYWGVTPAMYGFVIGYNYSYITGLALYSRMRLGLNIILWY
jgi:hypothetical protein